jgi:hypothetical protein
LAATYSITWRHGPEDKMNIPAAGNSKRTSYFDFGVNMKLNLATKAIGKRIILNSKELKGG